LSDIRSSYRHGVFICAATPLLWDPRRAIKRHSKPQREFAMDERVDWTLSATRRRGEFRHQCNRSVPTVPRFRADRAARPCTAQHSTARHGTYGINHREVAEDEVCALHCHRPQRQPLRTVAHGSMPSNTGGRCLRTVKLTGYLSVSVPPVSVAATVHCDRS
jgi:hypothetical protein